MENAEPDKVLATHQHPPTSTFLNQSSPSKFLFIIVCVWYMYGVGVGMCALAHVWRPEDKLVESVLFSYFYIDFKDSNVGHQTCIIMQQVLLSTEQSFIHWVVLLLQLMSWHIFTQSPQPVFFLKIYFHYFLCVHMCVYVCLCVSHTCWYRCPQRPEDLLKLELQAVVSCVTSVLGTNLRSSVRELSVLNYWALGWIFCGFR